MWLTWYSLTLQQKDQARQMSRFIVSSPEDFEYLIDEDNTVSDYRHIYD